MNNLTIDWNKLQFEYLPVRSHIKYVFENGKWDSGTLIEKPEITMSIAATCLHYGQECFEGLKAFRQKDGTLKVFRPEENFKRLNASADYLLCEPVPEKIFFDALNRVIKANIEYIPPYGTRGSLYIRPLLLGTSPTIGVNASQRYEFLIMVVPVGNYYKGGIKPVRAFVSEKFDRAAPLGSGNVKASGNYALGLKQMSLAKKDGFSIVLYPDSKTRTLVDEFGTSNFIGIHNNGSYLTPDSSTVLPSIINNSLMQIAKDSGIKSEKRPIKLEELDNFAEVGACGTAVIITPISEILWGQKIFRYKNECGPVLKSLYDKLTGIQFGELPDKYNWLYEVKI